MDQAFRDDTPTQFDTVCLFVFVKDISYPQPKACVWLTIFTPTWGVPLSRVVKSSICYFRPNKIVNMCPLHMGLPIPRIPHHINQLFSKRKSLILQI